MESHQNDSIERQRVRLSHEQYRRLLEDAIRIDLRFPWMKQQRYLLCNATVSDESVWLKPG